VYTVAVRCVASVDVMALAVTPGLPNPTVELDVKCVNCPVIVTLDGARPCYPLAGLFPHTQGRLIVYAADATALSAIPSLYAIAFSVSVAPTLTNVLSLGVLPSVMYRIVAPDVVKLIVTDCTEVPRSNAPIESARPESHRYARTSRTGNSD
jgi:hypothetical protein